jgi:hypothetical protein
MSPISDLTGTLLLCDWAEVVGGKLYAQGIGWGTVMADQPMQFAVASLVHIPYDQTNKKHSATIKLVTDDGVGFPPETPVLAGFQFEVGRPPGLTHGSEQIIPFAFKIAGIILPPGGYRFELHINDAPAAIASFAAQQK